MNSPLMQTYARLPVAFDRGEGAWLWDKNGKKYLDALAGIAVCGLGHAHPLIADAICDQARRLLHTSNIYEIPLQTQLAAELTALSGMDNAFSPTPVPRPTKRRSKSPVSMAISAISTSQSSW